MSLVAANVVANGGTCTLTSADSFTITLPSGLVTMPEGTGLTPPDYNDGNITCRWAPAAGGTQTATCTPNGTLTLTAGQSSGIRLPVLVTGTSGPLTSTFSGLGGQTVQMTTNILQCAAGAPLIDPSVAGIALVVAATLGGGLLLIRRRRRMAAATAV